MLPPPPRPPETTRFAVINREAHRYDAHKELKKDGREPWGFFREEAEFYHRTRRWRGGLRELRILLSLYMANVRATSKLYPEQAPQDLQDLYDAVRAHWEEREGQIGIVEAAICDLYARLEELLGQPTHRFGPSMVSSFARDVGGVYHVVFVDGGVSVYVGKSDDLVQSIYGCDFSGSSAHSALRRALLAPHCCADETAVTEFLTRRCEVQCLPVQDIRDRARLEHFAIAVLNPEYNRSLARSAQAADEV